MVRSPRWDLNISTLLNWITQVQSQEYKSKRQRPKKSWIIYKEEILRIPEKPRFEQGPDAGGCASGHRGDRGHMCHLSPKTGETCHISKVGQHSTPRVQAEIWASMEISNLVKKSGVGQFLWAQKKNNSFEWKREKILLANYVPLSDLFLKKY